MHDAAPPAPPDAPPLPVVELEPPPPLPVAALVDDDAALVDEEAVPAEVADEDVDPAAFAVLAPLPGELPHAATTTAHPNETIEA